MRISSEGSSVSLTAAPTSNGCRETSLSLLRNTDFCWMLWGFLASLAANFVEPSCSLTLVFQARLSLHAPSPQSRRLLEVCTNMFWTLRCCYIFWNICTRFFPCCSVTLGCTWKLFTVLWPTGHAWYWLLSSVPFSSLFNSLARSGQCLFRQQLHLIYLSTGPSSSRSGHGLCCAFVTFSTGHLGEMGHSITPWHVNKHVNVLYLWNSTCRTFQLSVPLEPGIASPASAWMISTTTSTCGTWISQLAYSAIRSAISACFLSSSNLSLDELALDCSLSFFTSSWSEFIIWSHCTVNVHPIRWIESVGTPRFSLYNLNCWSSPLADHKDVNLIDELHPGASTVFLRILNLAVVAVANVYQIVCPPVAPQRSDLVLVSNVPHDEPRTLVLHCLIIETDGRDCHCCVRFERWELGAFLHPASPRSCQSYWMRELISLASLIDLSWMNGLFLCTVFLTLWADWPPCIDDLRHTPRTGHCSSSTSWALSLWTLSINSSFLTLLAPLPCWPRGVVSEWATHSLPS